MKKLVFSLAAVSLIGGGTSALAQTQPQSQPQAQAQSQETLTDAKIVEVMKVANDGEVDLAKMAKSKAESKEVKEFAKKMIDEHKKNEKDVKDVAKKAKVKSEESASSKDLKNMAESKEKDLKNFKGKEFDKAYIDQQVSMHQQLLDDLNQKLIPAAQHPELKSYLEATKSHVQEHLSRAQEIQTTLNR